MPISQKPIARLSWTTADGVQEKLLKAGDVVTIGRGDNNTVVINSLKISRNHAVIEWNMERFVIRDLKSSNGTFVNGQRVENMSFPLKHGDEILLERLPFKFEATVIARNVQDALSMETVPADNIGKSPSLASIEIVNGLDKGKIFTIMGEAITIGRVSKQATWDVSLNDGTVSRPHAAVEKRGSSYYLRSPGEASWTAPGPATIEPQWSRPVCRGSKRQTMAGQGGRARV